jgi:uncharacterized tellurite resistance protein B-like protein
MIDRIKSFLIDRKARATGGHAQHSMDEFHLAAAALLVEVATVDEAFHDAERGRIIGFARDRLGLTDEEAATLVETATAEVADATQLFSFTRLITAGFSYDERVRLMQTLWEVALADGAVDPFEDQLLRRIGGLIHVTDRDRGTARKRAQAALRGARA